ncbi:MAG: SufD family Fe-S cluster assembly protein, partial [Candidatus Diapherotrites archaeon]|nr:SufD family Fe-S cluster assembly protein [Candidatus Diapherotrites archaeon]
ALRDDSLSLKDWFERFAIPSSKAEAFVNAHFNSGFVLVVDEKSDVSKVLEWSVEAGPDAVCKVLVVVKEGVQNALLLEQLMGRVPLWASLSLVVEQDANATVLRLFDLDADSFVFGSSLVGKDAQLVWSNGFLTTARLLHFASNQLVGEGAQVTQLDFLFGSDVMGLDLAFSNNHLVPRCFSRCTLQAVMTGASNVVFDGMIRIYPDAQQSDALLACHGMLLSKTSSANMIPGLEIQADDVKATHSASVVHIEDEALFYLRSRGITQAQAKKMLVSGFLDSVVLQLPEALQEKPLALLEEKADRLQESGV